MTVRCNYFGPFCKSKQVLLQLLTAGNTASKCNQLQAYNMTVTDGCHLEISSSQSSSSTQLHHQRSLKRSSSSKLLAAHPSALAQTAAAVTIKLSCRAVVPLRIHVCTQSETVLFNLGRRTELVPLKLLIVVGFTFINKQIQKEAT